MIPSKPQFSKAFKPVAVKSNHFPIKVDKKQDLYRYSLSNRDGEVDVVEIQAMIFNLDAKLKDLFKGAFWTSGSTLYTTTMLKAVSIVVEDGLDNEIHMELNSDKMSLQDLEDPQSKNHGDLVQFLNIYLAHFMRQSSYSEYGQSGKFFNFGEKGTLVQNTRLRVLSGFKVAAGIYKNGVPKIMIDWVSRVTREDSILDMFYEGLEFYPPETFPQFQERVS